jgi:hypothetical protein
VLSAAVLWCSALARQRVDNRLQHRDDVVGAELDLEAALPPLTKTCGLLIPD